MVVTGGGVSPDFRPPASRTAARDDLLRARPAIDGEYVLFTGGMDYRKNVDGLLTAYAGLSKELRDRYQLVIVGRLGLEDASGPFAELADSLGISDRVVLTGHVSDEELVLLYQGTSLFVFPSRYEGFGLPVIEALACGAPAIAGRNSSLVELVDQEEALFDADDPSSIQSALERALTDAELLESLRNARRSGAVHVEQNRQADRRRVPRPFVEEQLGHSGFLRKARWTLVNTSSSCRRTMWG